MRRPGKRVDESLQKAVAGLTAVSVLGLSVPAFAFSREEACQLKQRLDAIEMVLYNSDNASSGFEDLNLNYGPGGAEDNFVGFILNYNFGHKDVKQSAGLDLVSLKIFGDFDKKVGGVVPLMSYNQGHNALINLNAKGYGEGVEFDTLRLTDGQKVGYTLAGLGLAAVIGVAAFSGGGSSSGSNTTTEPAPAEEPAPAPAPTTTPKDKPSAPTPEPSNPAPEPSTPTPEPTPAPEDDGGSTGLD